MNKDIRLAVSLTTHPKTIKLMRKCGDRAFYNLIRLWTFAAMNKPDGFLHSMGIEDIEIASDWNGEDGIFFNALIDLKFLDCKGGEYYLHDWDEHNEYASHAKERSDKAREAARARWNKKDNKNNKLMLNDANSNANACSELCPSPTPIPTPIPTPSLSRDRATKNKKTSFPENFQITDNMKSWALKNGLNVDLEVETENFKDHHESKGNKFIDWVAAWRTWVRRSAKYDKAQGANKIISFGNKLGRSEQNALACKNFIDDMLSQGEQ